MSWIDKWKSWAKALKIEAYTLYYAMRDTRTPWYAKLVGGIVVAYALSPIDLIPDPIPVLGYLDDLILLPLGILLARKLIPHAVLIECREIAIAAVDEIPPNKMAAIVVIAVWILVLVGGMYVAGKTF